MLFYSQLSPSNETLVEQYREELTTARQWAKKTISLTTEQIADAERAEAAAAAAAMANAEQQEQVSSNSTGNGVSGVAGSTKSGGATGAAAGASTQQTAAEKTDGQTSTLATSSSSSSGGGSDEMAGGPGSNAGLSCCQKLALLAALVQVGAWKHLRQVLDYIPGPLAMLNERVHSTVIQVNVGDKEYIELTVNHKNI